MYVDVLLHFLMFRFRSICVVKFLSYVFFMFTFQYFGALHQVHFIVLMVSLWCPFTYLHSREAAASTRLAIIFGRIASGIAQFLCSTVVLMQLMYQYMYCQCSVTTVQALMLAVVALKNGVFF